VAGPRRRRRHVRPERHPLLASVFAAATKASFLIENIDDTCDILDEEVNRAFDGEPGPVHIS
jgi:hypothetical protein